ncbi:MAG TPA: hypothetical protein VEW28_00700 [Candidatus Kapabacteria bacterium]|nr:hypothetical protein [Candidatus Kapabacteria bacterium]
MRKQLQSVAFITFIVVVCLQPEWIYAKKRNAIPSPQQDTQQTNTATNQTTLPLSYQKQAIPTTDSGKVEDQKNEIEWDLAKYTLLLVLVTAILAIASFWQIFISRSTARRQLRAYLYCTTSPNEPLQTNVIPFIIKNSGQTPAYNVVVWIISGIREFPLIRPLVGGNPTNTPSRIAIHSNMDIEINATLPPNITNFRGQNEALYFWGRIEYEDIFRKRHHTNFRFHSFRVGIAKGEFVVTEITPSHEGNEAN